MGANELLNIILLPHRTGTGTAPHYRTAPHRLVWIKTAHRINQKIEERW